MTTRDSDDTPIRRCWDTPAAELVRRRMDRRQALATLAGAVAAVVGPTAAGCGAAGSTSTGRRGTTLTFSEIGNEITPTHRVADGYDANVLIRWGDPVLRDAPPFVPGAADPNAQARQFGYNNDFVAFMPLPRGSQSSDHGLLCVNHEYTDAELMWPDVTGSMSLSEAQARVEMMAHGHSVVEIRKRGSGRWETVAGSPTNRRITPQTPMRLTGPAAGHRRLQTQADPTGRKVLGTFNNCAGGTTPWGTVLIAEENVHGYFASDPPTSPRRPPITRGWASPTPRTRHGASSTRASTCSASRASPTATAGSSSTTPTTPSRSPPNGRPWAA